MYKIILLPNAREFLEKLSKSDKSILVRISRAIDSLQQDPFQGKPLKYESKGRYSLRVGVYRIIYRVDRKVIVVYVLDVGHRRNVYN